MIQNILSNITLYSFKDEEAKIENPNLKKGNSPVDCQVLNRGPFLLGAYSVIDGQKDIFDGLAGKEGANHSILIGLAISKIIF